MPTRSFAALAPVLLGGLLSCLPALAPNVRARGVHAGLGPRSHAETCMSCHVSEREALATPDTPTAAPIVADWMITEARDCGDCHRVSIPRGDRHADASSQAQLLPLERHDR